jgi:hypothetical protein
MDMIEEYRAYLADNPEGYWFKRKLYGYGWTPARWQGWAVTLAFILIVVGLLIISSPSYLLVQPTEVVLPLVALTALFVALCWKTGEPLKWQWGPEKTDNSH